MLIIASGIEYKSHFGSCCSTLSGVECDLIYLTVSGRGFLTMLAIELEAHSAKWEIYTRLRVEDEFDYARC